MPQKEIVRRFRLLEICAAAGAACFRMFDQEAGPAIAKRNIAHFRHACWRPDQNTYIDMRLYTFFSAQHAVTLFLAGPDRLQTGSHPLHECMLAA
ncbi:hypothetical protein [Undibacterium sp.]|uniref:hypothetical protein n=1 Tax=Undibacterium sp. TaxID=1914977 RepID=UPI002B8182AD|nr:hypothetical protein [Undibacterium sp.]HTD06605.1 hypothetical protein [Undibacterium sp.]